MSVAPEKQWRIDLAHHLKGARLQFRRYTRWSDRWDHDHCEACTIKFAEFEGTQIEHEGYTTCADYKHGAGYAWVCKACFEDLQGRYAMDSRRGWKPTRQPDFFNSLLSLESLPRLQ